MAEPKIDDVGPEESSLATLVGLIERTLDDGKAEEIVTIDLVGKSNFADCMIVASGRSARQVAALSDQVVMAVKQAGHAAPSVEGKEQGDWILIDVGDVIAHLFRPEVRLYYGLERMWSAPASVDGMRERL